MHLNNDAASRVAPRPTVELIDVTRELSAKQAALLSAMRDEDGATVQSLSKSLGMHPNTVRGHLEELVARKLVFTGTVHPGGRGRPSVVYYSRVPESESVANEYVGLITALAGTLPDTESAEQLGREWARNTQTEGHLINTMRRLGFDPEVVEADATSASATDAVAGAEPSAGEAEGTLNPADTPAGAIPDACAAAVAPVRSSPRDDLLPGETVRLLSCPFATPSGAADPQICAIHAGFIKEAFGADNSSELALQPLASPGECHIRKLLRSQTLAQPESN